MFTNQTPSYASLELFDVYLEPPDMPNTHASHKRGRSRTRVKTKSSKRRSSTPYPQDTFTTPHPPNLVEAHVVPYKDFDIARYIKSRTHNRTDWLIGRFGCQSPRPFINHMVRSL